MTGDRSAIGAAGSLINAGRPDDAAALLAGVIAADPADATALGMLSLAHLRARRWSEALAAADAAIATAPDQVPGWQRRSSALIELGRTADAEASAAEYLRLAPGDWHAHYTMGLAVRAVAGRRRAALDHVRRAVELAPDNADAHNLLGVIHRSLEDRTSAETAYRRALAIDPTHALARCNLALLTLGRGDTDAVLAGLREAAASDPQQAVIHRNMVLVAVLVAARYGTWLAIADLVIAWFVATGEAGAYHFGIRLCAFVTVLTGWAVLTVWLVRRLNPYLRTLVPNALTRLLRGSDARWALVGIAVATACALAGMLLPPPGLVVVLAGYVLLLGGSLLSRRRVALHRDRARRS